MKKIGILLLFILLSFAEANEVYQCKSGSVNMKLSLNDNSTITLNTKLMNYKCVMSETNFPGTEIPLNQLICHGQFKNKNYYFTRMSEEEIILSPDWILQKNIKCFKIQGEE